MTGNLARKMNIINDRQFGEETGRLKLPNSNHFMRYTGCAPLSPNPLIQQEIPS